jgi:hypothetical protein
MHMESNGTVAPDKAVGQQRVLVEGNQLKYTAAGNTAAEYTAVDYTAPTVKNAEVEYTTVECAGAQYTVA